MAIAVNAHSIFQPHTQTANYNSVIKYYIMEPITNSMLGGWVWV